MLAINELQRLALIESQNKGVPSGPPNTDMNGSLYSPQDYQLLQLLQQQQMMEGLGQGGLAEMIGGRPFKRNA